MTPAFPESLHFGHPLLLLPIALVLVAIVAGLLWESRRRRAALARLASPELRAGLMTTSSPLRRTLKRLLLLGATTLALLALAAPRWGFHEQKVQRRGIELMFAVDTSKSMLATDLTPDRLTRAKLAIADLVRAFPSDRVGLVAFAGEAFLQVPMTFDRDVFSASLRTLQPGVIPVGGSDLASAITEADRAYSESGAGQRILILISDGEDLQGSAVEAARTAAEHGVVIYTVGVGGTAGQLLTVPDGRGGTQVVRDEHGNPVTSRLDEATLTAIAAASDGAYVPLGTDGSGLDTLYRTHLANLERRALQTRSHRIPYERYAWLLVPALLGLFLEPWIRERGGARPLARGAVAASLVVLLLGGQLGAVARASTSASPEATYNTGVSAYEDGDWSTAAEQWTAALASAPVALHQASWYNLGSARFREGEATLDEDPGKTRESWEASLQAFETAVELDPSDEDAVYNRDLVKRKLDELDEQQQDSDGTCDNPSDESGGGNESDEPDDGDGSDQDQSADGDQGSDESDANAGEDGSDEQGAGADQDGTEKDDASGDQDGAAAADGAPGTEEQPASPGGEQPAAQEDQQAAGLAAASPGEDGGLSPEQAAALVRMAGGDGATVPLFAPAPTRPQDKTPNKDW